MGRLLLFLAPWTHAPSPAARRLLVGLAGAQVDTFGRRRVPNGRVNSQTRFIPDRLQRADTLWGFFPIQLRSGPSPWGISPGSRSKGGEDKCPNHVFQTVYNKQVMICLSRLA